MMDRNVNKTGQLFVVIAGFFAGQTALWIGCSGSATSAADLPRTVVTAVFLLSLAVRYWWVILMLEWPFRVGRTVLLLLVWSAAIEVATLSRNSEHWLLALAAVAMLGTVTEAYNTATKQWMVAGPRWRTEQFLRDHHAGIAAAFMGTAVLLAAWAIGVPPRDATIGVGVLVAADWVRLIEMVGRHSRLEREGTVSR
jgi:hypothetical protein